MPKLRIPQARVCAAAIVFALAAHGEPQRVTLDFDGEQREYYVSVPKDYVADQTCWLIVSVHGGGGNGRSHFLAQGIRHEVNATGFNAIVVSPSFSNADPNASRFPSIGEDAFLLAVVDNIKAHYDVHEKFFVTGYSRGGQFSHRFAFAHPDKVKAVAPLAAGTWTTPEGALLIESYGEVSDPNAFLSDPTNASKTPERLAALFEPRVANAAGKQPHPDAKRVPFFVMCGTLDTRYEVAQSFAAALKAAGYDVQTSWPRTPHGSHSDPEFKTEFEKYAHEVVQFLMGNVAAQ